MAKDQKNSSDSYLQEILERHRPSSNLKLIAAWDGLSIETQINILSNTETSIPREIVSKGLRSHNDYIRYLIASRFFYASEESDEDKELLKIISEDKNILIKYTHFPSQKVYVWEKDENGHEVYSVKPENFYLMSREEQVLYFSNRHVRDGENIAKIIEWGFNHQIDQEHIADLIQELSYNFREDSLEEYDEDGYTEFLKAKNLEALWRLVPKLGETKPAKYLIWSLPTSACFMSIETIEEVINILDKKMLIDLLERKDFYYFDLREKISNSNDPKFDEDVKSAAATKLRSTRTFHSENEDKSEVKRFIILFVILVFGIILKLSDQARPLAFLCIYIPIFLWVVSSVKSSINSIIDDVVNKIDKKIKKRLKKIISD